MQTARTSRKKTAFALLASVACTQAFAQEEPAEEAPREYNVEVIVFTYEQDVSVGTEVFLPEPVPEPPVSRIPGDVADGGFTTDDVAGMADRVDTQRVESESPTRVPGLLPEFVITPVDELGMTDILARLERLDVYNPVLHAAWTQPALPREQGFTMDLAMLANPPPNLSGSFELYLSRFLHLVVDLTLDNGNAAPIAVDVPGQSLFSFDEPERRPGVVHYRIQDDRIFKNGDTRYFDHPRFGVIARVTRIEPTEDDQESADVEALDGGAGDEVVE